MLVNLIIVAIIVEGSTGRLMFKSRMDTVMVRYSSVVQSLLWCNRSDPSLLSKPLSKQSAVISDFHSTG